MLQQKFDEVGCRRNRVNLTIIKIISLSLLLLSIDLQWKQTAFKREVIEAYYLTNQNEGKKHVDGG